MTFNLVCFFIRVVKSDFFYMQFYKIHNFRIFTIFFCGYFISFTQLTSTTLKQIFLFNTQAFFLRRMLKALWRPRKEKILGKNLVFDCRTGSALCRLLGEESPKRENRARFAPEWLLSQNSCLHCSNIKRNYLVVQTWAGTLIRSVQYLWQLPLIFTVRMIS